MKNIKKITFCAIIAALCSVVMVISYIPYLTYTAPAIASVFIMICFIETGGKYTLYAYLASAIIIFLFAEPESKVVYAVFFGNYPLLKYLYEKPQSRVLQWVLKILSFNFCILIIYFVLKLLTGFSLSEFESMGKWGAYFFLALSNGAFVVFDIALSRLAGLYVDRLHERVSKNFKP